MAFTDRFIKIPIQVYDVQEAELMDKKNYVESFIKVNPFDITYYKPTGEEGSSDFFTDTYMVLKNGFGFFIPLHIAELEKLLNTAT